MTTKPHLALATLACTVALAGCGGSDSNSGGSGTPPAVGVGTLTVDATAGGTGAAPTDPANKYTYVNLDSGETVALTDAEAATSTDWHIAFKRSSVKLNGGVSGPGSVRGAVADDQADFYDGAGEPNASVFTNATAAGELPAFQAVTDDSGLSYVSDSHRAFIDGSGSGDSWWLYNFMDHSVSGNTDSWWSVRSAGGDSYAKLHVSNIVQATRAITLEMYIQGSSDLAFGGTPVSHTATLGAGGGSECYDIDTTAAIDCGNAGWDIKIEVSADGRAWNLWTNAGTSGGGDGGAFGPLEDPTDYTSGTLTSTGTHYGSLYGTDRAAGVFLDSNWYAYNLEFAHKLWPNYRVYAIDTGTTVYKLQILSYYDNAGTSGHYTVRFEEL